MAFFTSLKLSSALLVIMAISAAKATFIETDVGRDGAYALVYGTRWFEAVLALLAVCLMLQFIKRWPYRLRQSGFMLVHLSIVVILVGAGITRYFGYEGMMHIREGETVDYVYSSKKHVQVVINGERATYPVRLWRAGENDIWQKVSVAGKSYELGVTEYWPYYDEVYQEGEGGPAGFVFQTDPTAGQQTLLAGKRVTIGAVKARFLETPFSAELSSSRYGDLRLNVEGNSCLFPVVPGQDTVFNCHGYRFQITEFQSAFVVGGTSDPDGPLINPMIRVGITAPSGEKGERLLFALHPDFSMGHSGQDDDQFAKLDMLYQVNQGLEFTRGGSTGVMCRATFDMTSLEMATQTTLELPAGVAFELHDMRLYRDTSRKMHFVPVRVMSSVVLAPIQSDNKDNVSAARVAIRDAAGQEADAICVLEASPERVALGDISVDLSFAPVKIKVPYSIRLDDFVLQTYPGSDNPATYESYVSLFDEEQGFHGEQKIHVYMNYPLNHRGSKHFQSSYDQDRKGTILSVNHDPGKWPTYFGYIMITIGFVLIIAKDSLFPIKKKRSSASPTVAAVLVALLASTAGMVRAQNQGSVPAGGEDAGVKAPQASGFVVFSDRSRDLASRLIVQDYRGRMKPVDTMAREMVMKVSKKTKFDGYEPVDMFLAWSLNPGYWWDRPVLAVRFAGLRKALGAAEGTRYVSPGSLFDEAGHYRLSDIVQAAHRTPDRDRTKTQRKLISFDERFELLYITLQGQSLAIYPVPGDANNKWLDYEKVQEHLTPEQLSDYKKAHLSLQMGAQSGNHAQLMDGLTRVKALQQKYGAEVLPSAKTVQAELIYNRSHIWAWVMIPLLLTFVVMMGVYLYNLFRHSGAPLSYRNPFYTLGVVAYGGAFAAMIAAYIMRWIASGRIPISNGHESLLFISLAVALSGLVFELRYHLAAPAGLGALLTTVTIGISMLSTFDPAIGPLVPVLVSYWLNIHVTIITSSYGFLGLSALIGALILFLMLAKKPGREHIHEAIKSLDKVNKQVLITGLGLLSVGTLLGGVWANESWGRYWGWDAKETWALITILVYAVVLHFRFIKGMRSVWLNASASLAAISSVVMTYFGVNYFLSGLHSYAQGDAAKVPDWVFIGAAMIVVLIAAAGWVNKSKEWTAAGE